MEDVEAVIEHYESIREEDRIATGFGQLELVRTKEILQRHLPDPPARIVDIGGGTGVHALWLEEAGHSVHVVDVTPRHVEKVQVELGPRGVTAELGDARELPLPDGSFDVALLLGPLYHPGRRVEVFTYWADDERLPPAQSAADSSGASDLSNNLDLAPANSRRN
jgi:SAM-dependent methyltransferase